VTFHTGSEKEVEGIKKKHKKDKLAAIADNILRFIFISTFNIPHSKKNPQIHDISIIVRRHSINHRAHRIACHFYSASGNIYCCTCHYINHTDRGTTTQR
jgi:hypothetical protein